MKKRRNQHASSLIKKHLLYFILFSSVLCGIIYLLFYKYHQEASVKQNLRLLTLHQQQLANFHLKPEQICSLIKKQSKDRLSLVNQRGKVICHSNFESELQQSFIDFDSLKFHRYKNYYIRKFKSRFRSGSFISLIKPLKPSENQYYLKQTFRLLLDPQFRNLRNMTMLLSVLLLFLVFLYFSYYIVSTEGHIFYKIKRLRSRLNSKGIYTATSLNQDNSIIDEIGLVDRQINQTISTLKSLSKNQLFEKEKLQSLLDSLNIGLISTDSDQKILFSNDYLRQICPLKTPNPGMLWEYFRQPDFIEKVDETLQTQENTELDDFSLNFHNQKKSSYHIGFFPLMIEKKSPMGLMIVFTDKTQVNLSNKMRVDFIANISHEVRTPLTALKGYMDLIKDDLSESKFVNKMNDNINRLITLFEDLLNLSLIESDRLLNNQLFSTENLTNETFSIVKTKFSDIPMNLEFESEIQEVNLDKDLIEQVFINLFENVFKYAPESEKIHTRWRADDQHVFIDFIDFGPGIKSKHQHRVFERFYRTEKSRSQKVPGTGLGLSIVKNIIEKHGGNIYLESEKNKGLHFKITIPHTLITV